MKYGPIQDFEEAMILNEGLDSAIEIIESSKVDFSKELLLEYNSILMFIKKTKTEGKALQFWL
jgi:hypothetical protein